MFVTKNKNLRMQRCRGVEDLQQLMKMVEEHEKIGEIVCIDKQGCICIKKKAELE